jgi:hypothetical protein
MGLKRPGREADYSSPAEVKECVELYLHSPNMPSWRGAQLKHRDKFTFYLYLTCTFLLLTALTVAILRQIVSTLLFVWRFRTKADIKMIGNRKTVAKFAVCFVLHPKRNFPLEQSGSLHVNPSAPEHFSSVKKWGLDYAVGKYEVSDFSYSDIGNSVV